MRERLRRAVGEHGALLGDAGIAALVALVVGVAISADLGGERGPDALAYLFAVCLGALMLVRRPFPVLALVTTSVGLIAYYTAGYPAIGLALPVAAALYSAAEAGRIRAAACTAVALQVISTSYRLLHGQDAAYLLGYELVTSLALMGAAIALGDGVRARRALRASKREQELRAARELEREGERRMEEERLRIARDIHDVLATTIAVIGVQANVASEAVADDPAATRAALATIQSVSTDAAREMRSTLGLLGTDGADTSRASSGSLRQLETLARATRDSGLPVTIRVEGEPGRVPAVVDATAYRIVREALTNSLRHADATGAEVRVRHAAGHLELEVRDDGRGPDGDPASSGGSGGHGGWGIAGMRERAALLGGQVETGAAPGGGFLVRASLPLDDA